MVEKQVISVLVTFVSQFTRNLAILLSFILVQVISQWKVTKIEFIVSTSAIASIPMKVAALKFLFN